MLLTIRKVLTDAQRHAIRASLDRVEFEDGRVTAGESARGVKTNLQAKADCPDARAAEQRLVEALQANQPFVLSTRPRAIVAPLFARYGPDMEYGRHLDNPMMGGATPVRTDIAVTVFLNDPADYDGGELVIDTDYGPLSFKGDAGDAVLYPATMPHRVTRVTRGERLVAVVWVQSMVKSAEQRRVLFDLAMLVSRLKDARPEERELAQKCYYNVFRMWADV